MGSLHFTFHHLTVVKRGLTMKICMYCHLKEISMVGGKVERGGVREKKLMKKFVRHLIRKIHLDHNFGGLMLMVVGFDFGL